MMSTDSVKSTEPAHSTGEGSADEAESKARSADADGGQATEAVEESSAKDVAAGKARPWWRRAKVWVGGAATVIVTGALAIWVASLLASFVGPRTSDVPSSTPVGASSASAAAIVNPGHLPGRDDVSTMAPHQRFYAVPNFYYLPSCGRPCWLPLYQQPTEQSAFVTDGLPCEYYGPNHSSEPSCIQPPTRRTKSEMADPARKDSGDKLLIVCQLRQLGNGQALPTIHNQNGQGSNIWDMVAVPVSYISPDSPAGQLNQVPGMPEFDEAFAPDIWLGNTGWHGIPCS
jgi:hypothetical protein